MTISDQQILSIFSNEMNLCMSVFWKQIGLALFVSVFVVLLFNFYKYKKKEDFKIDFKKSFISLIVVFCLCSLSATPSFINFIKYNNYLNNFSNLNVATVKITEMKQLEKKSGNYIYFTYENKQLFLEIEDNFFYSTLSKNNSVVIIYDKDLTKPIYIMKGKYGGEKFQK